MCGKGELNGLICIHQRAIEMRIWSLLGLALQLDGSYLALSLSWRLEGARALAGYRAPKSPAAGQLACQPRRVVAKRKRKQKRKQKPIA